MKLITFKTGNGPRLGVVVDHQVVDLAEISPGDLPANMRSFLELGEAGMETARSAVERALTDGQTMPLDVVTILAPVLNPSKVIAIGLNYMDHCREQNVEPPKSPIIFTKFSTAIVGPGEAIRWDPDLTSRVDFEAELAVVMGRRAWHVSQAEALDYVAGYTICHDVSARDLQFGDGQWVRGKSLDTFCPLGPWIVTRDEIPDPNSLEIKSWLNGELMQSSNTSQMIFNIPSLLKFLSENFTLTPGDVILTGTPEGVGAFREPPIFMKEGDEIIIDIEGIGKLENTCRTL